MPPPRPGTRWVTDFFSYETTKSVVVKSWVVGAVNRGVQLLILAYFIGWVFLHEKAYQVRDTVIESSVVTKVKGIGRYAGRVLDTADYVTPHQGTSVFVVVTKQILTENQAQGVCPESEAEYRCTADRDCQRKGPTTGSGLLTGRCVPYNGTLRTCEIQGWCPPEVDTIDVPIMLEAENFTLFIKNSIRFPLFGFEKANLPPPGSRGELGRCRFHPEQQPLCPILRLGDVVRLAGQDFPTLAATVLPLAGRHRAPHPHQGLRHPLRRPGVRQCREVWHCPHPHQHGGSFHLHRRGHSAVRYHPAQLPEGSRALQGPQVRGGARGWHARAPHQPHGVSPRGAGGLQPRQAVHRLGHLLPRSLDLGAMGQPPTCPPLWGSPLPAPSRGAPAPSPPQPPQWLAPLSHAGSGTGHRGHMGQWVTLVAVGQEGPWG
ncbi:P2X purinoceptor 3 isoform X2 [Accipiter gentilis]|uniref:P2X purinoceptor 3 isoform X2 n=1 Tax=Astur gentilis TaxID=8957 RepID=UPI00210FF049|nr:P2X purinoceptor 3 isoform X2 [Accipiter gentilis]